MRLERRGLLARHFRRAGFRDVRTEAVPVATVYTSVEEFAGIQMESALSEVSATLAPGDSEPAAEEDLA